MPKCAYEMPTIWTVHEGQLPNLFNNWADTSLRLPLTVAPPGLAIFMHSQILADTKVLQYGGPLK